MLNAYGTIRMFTSGSSDDRPFCDDYYAGSSSRLGARSNESKKPGSTLVDRSGRATTSASGRESLAIRVRVFSWRTLLHAARSEHILDCLPNYGSFWRFGPKLFLRELWERRERIGRMVFLFSSSPQVSVAPCCRIEEDVVVQKN